MDAFHISVVQIPPCHRSRRGANWNSQAIFPSYLWNLREHCSTEVWWPISQATEHEFRWNQGASGELQDSHQYDEYQVPTAYRAQITRNSHILEQLERSWESIGYWKNLQRHQRLQWRCLWFRLAKDWRPRLQKDKTPSWDGLVRQSLFRAWVQRQTRETGPLPQAAYQGLEEVPKWHD